MFGYAFRHGDSSTLLVRLSARMRVVYYQSWRDCLSPVWCTRHVRPANFAAISVGKPEVFLRDVRASGVVKTQDDHLPAQSRPFSLTAVCGWASLSRLRYTPSSSTTWLSASPIFMLVVNKPSRLACFS